MVSPFGTGSGTSSSLQLSDGKGLVILKGHAAVQRYTILINAVDGADRLSECEQNQSQKIDGGGLSRLPVQLLASSRRLVTDPALTAELSASLGVFVAHSRGAKAGQATAMLGKGGRSIGASGARRKPRLRSSPSMPSLHSVNDVLLRDVE